VHLMETVPMATTQQAYILAVDDDVAVLRAVERDLRKQFAGTYRILGADSPEKALQYVRQLTARGDRIALFVVDQRMPSMSGTEFLREALPMQPDARRVLLTAYADSSAAIDAINRVKLNHYLMKPWEPPEQNLFPVLSDLLEDWNSSNVATFDGTYIVGARWNPETHRLKDFLAKSQIPYRTVEPGAAYDPRLVAALGDLTARRLPAVVFPDGAVLERPDTATLASKLGLATTPNQDFYDVVVIGAGPAGLACALYCTTEGLRTVLVEREAAGGQAGLSSRIENYLGFPAGLSGADLARRGVAQVRRFGAEILAPASATKLAARGDYRIVTLDNGRELVAHAVVIATGVQWRLLEIPGMAEYTGAGVYYGAATTEAASCQDEDVYIVGGANSAGQAAVHFSELARSVTMIVRADTLAKSMSHYLVQRIQEIPNIHVIPNAEVTSVEGEDGRLARIQIQRHDTKATEERDARALFVFIGAEPHTQWLEGTLLRDHKGFLCTGANLVSPPAPGVTSMKRQRPPGWTIDRDPYLLETSMPGVFAVGDVRDGAVRRVANSVGEGSIVLYFIRQHMRNR
jgi:thioredoxin reductase (NADPH)